MGNFLNRPFIHRMYKSRNGLNVDVGERSCGEQGMNRGKETGFWALTWARKTGFCLLMSKEPELCRFNTERWPVLCHFVTQLAATTSGSTRQPRRGCRHGSRARAMAPRLLWQTLRALLCSHSASVAAVMLENQIRGPCTSTPCSGTHLHLRVSAFLTALSALRALPPSHHRNMVGFSPLQQQPVVKPAAWERGKDKCEKWMSQAARIPTPFFVYGASQLYNNKHFSVIHEFDLHKLCKSRSPEGNEDVSFLPSQSHIAQCTPNLGTQPHKHTQVSSVRKGTEPPDCPPQPLCPTTIAVILLVLLLTGLCPHKIACKNSGSKTCMLPPPQHRDTDECGAADTQPVCSYHKTAAC